MRSEIKIGLLVALGVIVVGGLIWNARRPSGNGSLNTLPWDNGNRNSNINSAAPSRLKPGNETARTPPDTGRPTPVTPPGVRPGGAPSGTAPPPAGPTAGRPGTGAGGPPIDGATVPPRTSPTLPPLGLLPESSGATTPERGPAPGGPGVPPPGGSAVPTTLPAPRGSTPPVEDEPRTGPGVAVPPAGPLPPPSGALPPARPDSVAPPRGTAGATRHKIAEDETLWAIAEKYLGSGARWPEIKAANPGLNEGRLLVGKEITIPAGTAASSSAGPTSPSATRSDGRPEPRGTSATPAPNATTSGRDARPAPREATAAPRNGTGPAPRVRAHTYRVEEGDSLVSIARNILNNGDRWREIYELNKAKIGKNPDVLFVGLDLKLPE